MYFQQRLNYFTFYNHISSTIATIHQNLTSKINWIQKYHNENVFNAKDSTDFLNAKQT